MIDPEQFAAVRLEAGPCPNCGTAAARPILWGYPAPGEREHLGDSVSWGSGFPPPIPSAYECSFCGLQFGMPAGLPPELQYCEEIHEF